MSMRSLRVLPGDSYLLCSDGLSDVLDEDRLLAILCEAHSPEDQVRALLDGSAGEVLGAQDNTAAIVVECKESGLRSSREGLRAQSPSEPLPLPATRLPYSSSPEIIIVGVETHVVPTQSASASSLDALGRFSRLRSPARVTAHPRASAAREAACRICPSTLARSSSYFRRTARVDRASSGSMAFAPRANNARAQSIVSAMDGGFRKSSCRTSWANAASCRASSCPTPGTRSSEDGSAHLKGAGIR